MKVIIFVSSPGGSGADHFQASPEYVFVFSSLLPPHTLFVVSSYYLSPLCPLSVFFQIRKRRSDCQSGRRGGARRSQSRGPAACVEPQQAPSGASARAPSWAPHLWLGRQLRPREPTVEQHQALRACRNADTAA